MAEQNIACHDIRWICTPAMSSPIFAQLWTHSWSFIACSDNFYRQRCCPTICSYFGWLLWGVLSEFNKLKNDCVHWLREGLCKMHVQKGFYWIAFQPPSPPLKQTDALWELYSQKIWWRLTAPVMITEELPRSCYGKILVEPHFLRGLPWICSSIFPCPPIPHCIGNISTFLHYTMLHILWGYDPLYFLWGYDPGSSHHHQILMMINI